MSDTRARRAGDRLLLVAICVVASLCLAKVAFVHGPTAGDRAAAATVQGVAHGEPREADREQIRRLILEKRLSDREAEHYRVLESAEQPPAASTPSDR